MMSTEIQTTVTLRNPHGIDGGDRAQSDTADEAQQQPPRVYAEDFPEAVVDGVAQFLGKPRARGWIHVYAAIVAFIAGAALVSVSWSMESTRAGLATLLYTFTIVAMFAVSGTYHRVNWRSESARKWMKRADHAMIFVFIAGSYTPFALLALPSEQGGRVCCSRCSARRRRAGSVCRCICCWVGSRRGSSGRSWRVRASRRWCC